MEHAETPVDEQNNSSDEKQNSKMSNIAKVFDSSPNTMTSKIKLVIVFIGKLLNTFFISTTIKLIFIFVFLVSYYG